MKNKKQKVAIVTGAAGFIGFHISKLLLDEGWRVVGIDSMSDYYDVSLKVSRESILLSNISYRSVHEKIESKDVLMNLFAEEQPDAVIHLAAQAGVRYSLENPRTYLESNIVGTFELLEAARANPPQHMLLASTSSAYGANENMPYRELEKADHQMSFYAATKKSTENMAHSYAHLFNLPITMFRFFTVYGPWGRPDMALFKFTKSILEDKPIDVFNGGDMSRDFTYVDDLVASMRNLIDTIPINKNKSDTGSISVDNISPVAPFRVVNIGNSEPELLTNFIKEIENALGKVSQKNMLPMQAGDVPSTWADTALLRSLTGFQPKTNISEGIREFLIWYIEYYGVDINLK